MAGVGSWAAYLVVAMKQIEMHERRLGRLETLEAAIGRAHDHDGGDGAVIPLSGLAAAVQALLVTNGDSHDHDGGDGAQIPLAALVTAVQNMLVTNGDSHNHDGGDGAAIDTGALVNKAVTTAKIDDLAVDTGQIASKAVTTAKIDDLAVDTGQIANDAITTAKINAGAVDTTELANDAVDDTKAGNRVPQLYRRKGGSSSNWSTSGSSNYTPGAVRMQCGSASIGSGGTSISFPTSFGGAPVVVTGAFYSPNIVFVVISSVSSSSFTAHCIDHAGNQVASGIFWLAIGPE